mgnify:CR=1 FL=1
MPICFKFSEHGIFYCLCYLTACQLRQLFFFGLFTVCFLLQLQNLLRAGNPSTLAEDLFDISV